VAAVLAAIVGLSPFIGTGQEEYRVVRAGGGVRCISKNQPDVIATVTYRAEDANKSEVPSLSAMERATLRRISSKVHSGTLRFAWIRPPYPRLPDFVVFDAKQGPCPAIPGYGVLNGSCNVFFSPTRDRPLAAAPFCVGHTHPL
jgi:hypothetical protein